MGEAATATKAKKNRISLAYELLTPRLDDDGNTVGYDIVPTPSNVKKDQPRHEDFRRGVKAALEAGKHADDYNGKPLIVAGLRPAFTFTAAVKEEVVRKVTISES